MNQTSVALPEGMSRNVLNAIQGALEEEKQPRSRRILKIAGATLASTAILTVPIALILKEQMTWAWQLAALVWTICFALGFSFHYHPQPRISVPGYWSPFAFGRILVAMTALTWLQVLLCPSFVFLESPLAWNPFTPLTAQFMKWGGMKACMLCCGFLFSGIAGLFALVSIRRVLLRSTKLEFLRATGLAFLTQLPLIGIQVIDPGLRPFSGFWGLGSILGLACMALVFRGISALKLPAR